MFGAHNNPQGKTPSPIESPPKLMIRVPSTKASTTLKDVILRIRRQLSKMDSDIDYLYNVSNIHDRHHKESLQRHQHMLQGHQKKLEYHQEMLEKVTDDHLPFESVKKDLDSLQTSVKKLQTSVKKELVSLHTTVHSLQTTFYLQQHAMEDLNQRLVRQLLKKATKQETQWLMDELRKRIDILTQMIQHPDKKQTLQAQLDALNLRKMDIRKNIPKQKKQQQKNIPIYTQQT